MSNKPEKLTPKQHAALAALLELPTLGEVAERVGVNVKTLSRWLADDTFRQALNQVENAVIDAAARRLVALADKAAAALESVLSDPSQRGGNVKRLTAQTIFDYVMRLREFNQFEERLARLEEKIK